MRRLALLPLLLVGCGSPFYADATMTRDASPEASDDAAPDTRATDDAGPDARDAGADAQPGNDAAPEAAPDATPDAPDASPDGAPDTGSDADADADGGPCTLQAPSSFLCGANMASVGTPGDFCRLEDQTSTGVAIATPAACQCAGAYTCACLLAALTTSELCPVGTFDSCGDDMGHQVVVRCAP
jgi:hypothetical protein